MRVLHVNTNDTGGAAIAARRLHLLLLDIGIESKMLFLKRQSKTPIPEAYYIEDQYSTLLFKAKEKLNALYNRRRTLSKTSVYFNGAESLFDITKHPLFQWAEVIHLHWVVKLIDWKTVFSQKKSFVWTFHDMNPFTGGEHYKTGYNNEFSNVSKDNIALKKGAIKDSKIQVVCPSKWLAQLAKASEVFENFPVSTVRNPIDIEVFRPIDKSELKAKYGLDANKKTILFVAENPHDERKGFQLLMNALPKLNNSSIELAVIGNASHINTDLPNAHFFGSISDEQTMVELYNAADVFIIPSIEDNLPNTVSESLLCGTPVVGLKVGGIQEMVKDGINGYLAEKPEDLSIAIQSVLNSKFNADEISKNILSELDSQLILLQLKGIYEGRDI